MKPIKYQILILFLLLATVIRGFSQGCWHKVENGKGYGSNFTIGLTTDGRIYGWGYNSSGQLGVGGTNNKSLPTQIGISSSWKNFATGDANVIAIQQDGTLWTWGSSNRLGNNSQTNSSIPIKIGNESNWKEVFASQGNVFALKNDNTLWGCGRNGSGQLGDGTTTNKTEFVRITNDLDWKEIYGGDYFTVGLTADGDVWTWGSASNGVLGNGTWSTNVLAPKFLVGGAKKISAGKNFVVVLTTQGALFSWGINTNGQLGIGSKEAKNTPNMIGKATDWKDITAGGDHAIALKNDGSMWVWGRNYYGALGLGYDQFKISGFNSPYQIGSAWDWDLNSTTFDWAKISCGGFNSVAIKNDGSLYSWGHNWEGQVGNGKTEDQLTPILVDCPTIMSVNYSISTTSIPTVAGTTTGVGSYVSGSLRTVTATANTGYTFTNWTESGTVVSTSASYTFTVSGNRTLVANFTLQDGTCRTCPSYDLSILPNTSWQTQSSTIGLNGCMIFRIPVPSTPGYTYTFKTGCGDGATANFDTNLELFDSNCNLLTNNDDACSTLQSSITWISTYTAVAFIYVKVSGYTSTFGDFTLAFLRQDPVVNYTISTSSNPTAGGNTSGGGTVTSGSSKTVTAIANTGYTFTNWSENGTVISTLPNYTFTVSGNKTLVANFSASQVDLTTGLVAYYQFEGNANDLSGNGNNGTDIMGGVTFTAGKNGQAAKFGGYSSPGQIRVPNSTSLQFTTGASFVYWVRLDAAAGMNGYGSNVANGNHCVFAKDYDNNGIYNNMGYTAQNSLYTYLASSGNGGGISTRTQGVKNYSIGNWIHVAFVSSDVASSVYINGVKDSTVNKPINYNTSNTRDLYIGKYRSTWYPLNGALDEFRIYNRALTDSEVQQIYAKMNTSIPEVESYGTKIYAIKNNAIIESANGWEVRVIDICGRTIMIKNSNSDTFEVNIPVSGLYLIRLAYKEKIFCEKVIIQ